MSFRRFVYLCASLLLACIPAAHAAVSESDARHLALKYTVMVKATPDKAYAAVVKIGHWWNPEHTYSNDAGNLSIEPHAGGCFCEKWRGGSVQHMSVIAAMPGKMLRLSGGLGPLQSGALNGTMTWSFKAADGGTQIAMSYLVDGLFPGGLDKVATGVDSVLADQVERLQRFIDSGNPKEADK